MPQGPRELPVPQELAASAKPTPATRSASASAERQPPHPCRPGQPDWPTPPPPCASAAPDGRPPRGPHHGPGGRRGRKLALQRAPLVRVRNTRRQHLTPLRPTVSRSLPRLLGSRPGLHDPRREHEVLPQGMALEAVGEEERHQVRVALEADAEHLVRLALVPARARVHVDRGGQDGGVVRHGRAQEQSAYGRQGDDVRADAETGAGLVDRAQPVEVGAAQRGAGRFEGGDPRGRGNIDGEDLVRLLGRGVRAEDLLDGSGQPAGHRSPSPESSRVGTGGFTRPLLRAAADGRPAAASAP